MHIALVGLGRMGMNMARRLYQGKHDVVVYDVDVAKADMLACEGLIGVHSLEELCRKLPLPRVVWLMLPAGKPVDDLLVQLHSLLSKGDIIIEGGNTFFRDDIRRSEECKQYGIHYIDAGVSGGIWGLEKGYCTMVGGSKEDFDYIEPLLRTLAPKDGYLYCGSSGAGHFVKMVHNGIEYGMMEAYGEGFELLKASPYKESLNLREVAHLWNQGSVVRSWLLELLESAFSKDPELSNISGFVQDSGEGRWTVQQAVELGVSIPVIADALFKRFQSRQNDVFSDKVLAALRNEFGGHAVFQDKKEQGSSTAGAGKVSHSEADVRKIKRSDA